MTYVLGIAFVAAVVWYASSRSDTPPQQRVSQARDAATRTAQQIGSTSNEWIGKLRGRFDRTADYDAFRSWIASLVDSVPGVGEGAATFRAWVDKLAPADLTAFRKELASFCKTLDIEDGWLHNNQPGQRPDLRKALEETVGLYALAYARGAGQGVDIARAHVFQRWMAAPDRGANRAFGAKLYAAVVASGMATPPPEMLLAPERQRRAFADQTIREAAARDPQAFDALLAEVLNPTPKPAPAAETPAEPVVITAETVPSTASVSSRRQRSAPAEA